MWVKQVFCLISGIFISIGGFGQTIQWEKNYGGTKDDNANAHLKLPTGGFAQIGQSSSNDQMVSQNQGSDDLWVMNVGSSGTLKWESSFGGSNLDQGKEILVTPSGDLLCIGSTLSSDGDVSSNNGGKDVWVVKVDSSNGNMLWEETYGGSSSDLAESACIANGGGFILVGASSSNDGDVGGNQGALDVWVDHIDGSGNLQWEKNFGGSGAEKAFEVEPFPTGGYMVTGFTTSGDGDISGPNNGSTDYWIMKLDDSGNLEWEKNLGGSGQDIAYSLLTYGDGTTVVSGFSESSDGDVSQNLGMKDQWVLKLDSVGNLFWETSFGGSGNDLAFDMEKASQGELYIGGASSSNDNDVSSNNGDRDFWLTRIDTSGTLIWENSYGGSYFESGNSVSKGYGGNVVVGGNVNSDDQDVSDHFGGVDTSDFWLVSVNDTMMSSLTPHRKEELSFQVYPTPASESIKVELKKNVSISSLRIRDVQGHLHLSRNEGPLKKLDLSGLRSGVYFIEIKLENDQQAFEKIVIE